MNDPPANIRTSNRGSALLMALIVLAAMGMLAMFLVSSTAINRRMASDDVTKSKALRYAEAGVYEALNRIQNGLGPDPTAVNAAQKVVQILLNSSPGTAGADTTLLATGQPTGQWMNYSTSSRGANALTIEFLTNPARTQVYKYDMTKTPPIQTSSGGAIYQITSVGRIGAVSRRLVVQAITYPPIYPGLRGAVVSGSDIKYTGGGVTCGFNHRAVTPDHKGIPGRLVPGGCFEDVAAKQWEAGYGDMPGDMVYGTFSFSGANQHYGVPAGVSDGNVGFYGGPWDVFGMSQAAFLAWVGPCVAAPAVPTGVYYVDNDGIPGNRSNPTVSYNAPTVGWGLLYVDGELKLTNDFHFRGLVYCEGKLTATNQAWIIGSVVARGPASGRNDITGPNVFLYSTETVAAIPGAPAAGKVSTISWKEVP